MTKDTLSGIPVGLLAQNKQTTEEARGTKRERVLRTAMQLVLQDRNHTHGNPEDNFANIAAFWRSYLQMRQTIELTAKDVAHMMVLFKLARLATNSAHEDSTVDVIGYAACSADC